MPQGAICFRVVSAGEAGTSFRRPLAIPARSANFLPVHPDRSHFTRWLIGILIAMAGCAAPPMPPPAGIDNPSNPQAREMPMTPVSGTLLVEPGVIPATAPASGG
jgi:hypothetical protein